MAKRVTGFLDSLNRKLARLQTTQPIELDPETASHLSWRQVQNLVGDAFRRRGYGVRPGSTDAPVDFILDKDGERTVVNCKQWKVWEVGESPLRELYGYTTGVRSSRALEKACVEDVATRWLAAGAAPDGRIWIRGGDWPGPPEPAPGPPCPA